jgi:triphosphatase
VTKGKKPVEIELKLVLDSQDREPAIVSKMREQGYRFKQPDHVKNVDIYLDTFDWLLMKNKLSLRYRTTNGTPMYTLKSMGTIGEGIAKRMETEVRLEEPVEVPADVHAKQIGELIDDIIYPRKLVEHIQIRTDRRRYKVVAPEGAEMELSFDTSSFSTRGLHKPKRAQKLQEMEAEIITGSETALRPLASLLARAFHLQASCSSKLEVAIDRLGVVIPSKKPPEELRVRLDDRLDLAVRKILTYQLQRFREQIPGVQHDIDIEFVHQARVATRRMRSLLLLFGNAVPLSTGVYFGGELKWLGEMLGAVRDLDVFLLNLSQFKRQIVFFPEKKKKIFEDWIEKLRRKSVNDLICALESPRYGNFERCLIGFLERPLPLHPRASQAKKPVREIAPIVITEKYNAVLKQGHTVLENPKLKEFHRLRIQMKRLRYACEFMASAYEGELDKFINRTVEIQDCLGEIQDTVFTRGFVDHLFENWRNKLVGPALVFILGEIYQLQAEIAREKQGGFRKMWERLASEETNVQLRDVLSMQTAEK